MENLKVEVQDLLTKIQNQKVGDDKLKAVKNYSKQIESIMNNVKYESSLATKMLIDAFIDLIEANYRILLEGGKGGCPECLKEAELILDRITFPLA